MQIARVLMEVNQPLQASELLADCVTHLTKRWHDRHFLPPSLHITVTLFAFPSGLPSVLCQEQELLTLLTARGVHPSSALQKEAYLNWIYRVVNSGQQKLEFSCSMFGARKSMQYRMSMLCWDLNLGVCLSIITIDVDSEVVSIWSGSNLANV